MYIKLKFSLCLMLIASFAVAQNRTAENLEALTQLDHARTFLQDTEDKVGRYSMQLVEPIEQLVNRLMTLNQFEEADNLLDRAVQITRMNNGLHTAAQLNLIRKRIDNFSNRRAWDDAREQMEYLFTYYLRVPVHLNTSLLDDFRLLTNQHLRGVTEDEELEQGRHLSRVQQLNWLMISAARKLYGPRHPQLVPYLYRQAWLYYLFQKGRDEGGRDRTNANYYYTLNGRTSGWTKNATSNHFFSEGLRLLTEIRVIYSDLDPVDSEAVAMSDLYLGDWFMLFGHAGIAVESYENAYNTLKTSAVNTEQLEALFNKPRLLPLQEFYPNVTAALAGLPVNIADESAIACNSSGCEFSLDEWSVDYPTLRSPLHSYSRFETDSSYAHLAFRLPAENEANFFYNYRFDQSVGRPLELEVIEGFSGIEAGRAAALQRLRQLRFRPAMRDGRPVETRNTLKYSIAIIRGSE